MDKEIKYNENISKSTTIFNKNVKIEDEKNFTRTHYFTDVDKTSITPEFKNELQDLFGVTTIADLEKIVKGVYDLHFLPGTGSMSCDSDRKIITVYTESFDEDVIKPKRKRNRLKKSIGNMASNDGSATSGDITSVISCLTEAIPNTEINPSDMKKIQKLVPKLIKEGKIKISLQDVTDINKNRLTEIIEIGRGILKGERKVAKYIGIDGNKINDEIAWQKYFEKYGSYLLFGSTEVKGEQMVEARREIGMREKDSRIDILTINRYGFLDVVELKKSNEFLFKIDRSHGNVVPTAELSTAISQVNNYLMLLPYSNKHGELMKGSESANGLLIIGSNKTLINFDSNGVKKYLNDHSISSDDFKLKLRKALRDLNYSLSHIQIALYDEILDNLNEFLEKMNIESNE